MTLSRLRRPKQQGNILFLILLAVVLFAALSYAVTSSMRGGGNDASTESMKVKAAEIDNYVAGLSATIQRMTLTGGVPLHQIDFNTSSRLNKDGTVVSRNNTNCTTTQCEVYHPNGGGMAYQDFETYASTQENVPTSFRMPGHNEVHLERWEHVGSDLPEIILTINYLDQGLARAINSQYSGKDTLNVSNTPGHQEFTGSMTEAIVNSASTGPGRTGEDIRGKQAWCQHISNVNGTYSDCRFVLMAR